MPSRERRKTPQHDIGGHAPEPDRLWFDGAQRLTWAGVKDFIGPAHPDLRLRLPGRAGRLDLRLSA